MALPLMITKVAPDAEEYFRRDMLAAHRSAGERVARHWHGKKLVDHFRFWAARYWRYEPRAASYELRKRKRGIQASLMFSGRLRTHAMNTPIIRVTSKYIKARLKGLPDYITGRGRAVTVNRFKSDADRVAAAARLQKAATVARQRGDLNKASALALKGSEMLRNRERKPYPPIREEMTRTTASELEEFKKVYEDWVKFELQMLKKKPKRKTRLA